MRAFKLNRPASLNRLLIGVFLSSIATTGAHAVSQHRDNTNLSISGTPVTTDVAGRSYSFTPSAADSGHSTLIFSIAGKPAWASFDPTTGALAGTPTSANVGVFHGIVISVSDGSSTSSMAPFAITVAAPPDSRPTISGTPPTSTAVGSNYRFTPTAADANGHPLSFTIRNQPAWASFNPDSGALYGTTTSTDAGTYSNIVISVSDGLTRVSLPAFSITVAEAGPGGDDAEIARAPPTTTTGRSVLTDLAGYNIYQGTGTESVPSSVASKTIG